MASPFSATCERNLPAPAPAPPKKQAWLPADTIPGVPMPPCPPQPSAKAKVRELKDKAEAAFHEMAGEVKNSKLGKKLCQKVRPIVEGYKPHKK
ncbi:hypothetical protein U9M48_025006 [Paspalum notatum var. saurae]|uniref:Uncharacterized protein n=1 Tax=Paspalum notatum var. saurae TaxID=547442 RepID=A0AAQ3TSN1_PASNO